MLDGLLLPTLRLPGRLLNALCSRATLRKGLPELNAEVLLSFLSLARPPFQVFDLQQQLSFLVACEIVPPVDVVPRLLQLFDGFCLALPRLELAAVGDRGLVSKFAKLLDLVALVAELKSQGTVLSFQTPDLSQQLPLPQRHSAAAAATAADSDTSASACHLGTSGPLPCWREPGSQAPAASLGNRFRRRGPWRTVVFCLILPIVVINTIEPDTSSSLGLEFLE
mmetsp:Transcript_24406/g.60984  ORF Transcript_24406/g.60984 Transcript_24406/m.60984 type:complete len:224 (-) Transcript_24406:360-1031(-)